MEIKKSSKIRQIEKIPGVVEIVKKHSGLEIEPGMWQVVANMTLVAVAGQLGWEDDILQNIINDLNAAQK